MDHQKKLDFVLKMTKHALDSVPHFDAGGTVLSGPTGLTSNGTNPGSQGITGAVGNVLGTNNNFQATGAPIQAGTNTTQLNNAYAGAQGALNQAGTLANQLAPGVSQGVGSQNLLTNQLTAESMGQGPNPAQAALNQSTGQNIAGQAALMAGQRGAGANAGLIAREAAQQGAATQQQAVGQSATLQAQQQLAAQNALQGLASVQVGQGTGAVQLNNQTQQNEQNILQGANTANNSANVSMQGNINSTNAQVAAGNQQSNQGILGGVGNAIGSITGLFAKGGVVPKHIEGMAKIYHPHFASGGEVWQPSSPASFSAIPIQNTTINASNGFGAAGGGPTSGGKGAAPGYVPDENLQSPEFGAEYQGNAPVNLGMENNLGTSSVQSTGSAMEMNTNLGINPALTNPSAGMGLSGGLLAGGGKIPGKPKVNHDAYKNDIVTAKLTPGEVVIDLDTLKDEGKLGKMARFVAANIERKKMGRKA